MSRAQRTKGRAEEVRDSRLTPLLGVWIVDGHAYCIRTVIRITFLIDACLPASLMKCQSVKVISGQALTRTSHRLSKRNSRDGTAC